MILGKLLSPARELSPLVLRIVVGAVLGLNGARLLGVGSGHPPEAAVTAGRFGFPPTEIWGTVLGVSLIIIGVLLVAGLFTRYAALVLAALLVFGLIHLPDANSFKVQEGGFEYLLVGLGCALSLLFSGGGLLAVDKLLLKS